MTTTDKPSTPLHPSPSIGSVTARALDGNARRGEPVEPEAWIRDPAEVERLVREAREDDARMTPADWEYDAGRQQVLARSNYGRIAFDLVGEPNCAIDGPGIARTRNNLRAMADQLEAARLEVDRLESARKAADVDRRIAERDRDAARVDVQVLSEKITRLRSAHDLTSGPLTGAGQRIAELEAELERMAPVVAAAEAYRDDGAVGAGIVPAVDAYRAKVRR